MRPTTDAADREWLETAETLEEALDHRAAVLEKWLRAHAPDCATAQAHMIEGAPERAYWHYGYLIALRDVAEWLRTRGPKH